MGYKGERVRTLGVLNPISFPGNKVGDYVTKKFGIKEVICARTEQTAHRPAQSGPEHP